MRLGDFSGFDDDEPHWRGTKDKTDYSLQEKPTAKNYASTEEIDVDKALADQFAEAEAYRDHLLNNSESFAPNHVTGGITALNRIIEQIIKLRETVQNLARQQALEGAVIEVMKQQPKEVKDAFFAELNSRMESVK